MEFHEDGYYGAADMQGYYAPQGGKSQRPKRSIGGYIATALVSFILGLLVAALFFEHFRVEYEAPDFDAFFPTPGQSGAERTADPTPVPTERPMAGLDGEKPVIADVLSPIPDIVEQVSPAVVAITSYNDAPEGNARGIYAGIGSGFVISSEGYILTNAHVVEGVDSLSVTFYDGTEYSAELVGMDRYMDVAVVRVDGPVPGVLKMGDSGVIRVGEFVLAIGNPTGSELANTTTFGIISAVSRSININGISGTYIQTDAAVNPGSSGGALLNMQGEVIGITSAKTITADYDEYGNAISAEGLGFAIPINEALKTAEQLITKGYVLRPGIGVSVVSMDKESAEQYGTPEGVVVYSVTKDGPGHKAGLETNDIITECDGQLFVETQEFVNYIQQHSVGDTLHLVYWRHGETHTTDLVLADLNSLGSEIVDNAYADFEF